MIACCVTFGSAMTRRFNGLAFAFGCVKKRCACGHREKGLNAAVSLGEVYECIILWMHCCLRRGWRRDESRFRLRSRGEGRSEEHTSELQSPIDISYAVFCLKKKKKKTPNKFRIYSRSSNEH